MAKNEKDKDVIKTITRNKKALFNYFVDEEYEAGLVLLGTEVKSLRENRVELVDAYARFEDNELWMVNAMISPYPMGTHKNHAPDRMRKLLLHRRELNRLRTKIETAGYTLIPLELYFKGSHVKARIGLCRGKKLFDKRDAIQKREAAREIARATSQRRNYSKDT